MKVASALNPIQQGLKLGRRWTYSAPSLRASALNPIQQGLKQQYKNSTSPRPRYASALNPIQQGLKQEEGVVGPELEKGLSA